MWSPPPFPYSASCSLQKKGKVMVCIDPSCNSSGLPNTGTVPTWLTPAEPHQIAPYCLSKWQIFGKPPSRNSPTLGLGLRNNLDITRTCVNTLFELKSKVRLLLTDSADGFGNEHRLHRWLMIHTWMVRMNETPQCFLKVIPKHIHNNDRNHILYC